MPVLEIRLLRPCSGTGSGSGRRTRSGASELLVDPQVGPLLDVHVPRVVVPVDEVDDLVDQAEVPVGEEVDPVQGRPIDLPKISATIPGISRKRSAGVWYVTPSRNATRRLAIRL